MCLEKPIFNDNSGCFEFVDPEYPNTRSTKRENRFFFATFWVDDCYKKSALAIFIICDLALMSSGHWFLIFNFLLCSIYGNGISSVCPDFWRLFSHDFNISLFCNNTMTKSKLSFSFPLLKTWHKLIQNIIRFSQE